MQTQVPLRCRCGQVRGTATEVSPSSGNRLVCYCDDCQAFARFLERDDITDAAGGTDIYQMAASRMKITAGAEALRCVRLSPRGLIRWYTECCHTPVGNTVNARVPVIGVASVFMDHQSDGRSRDEVLGPPVCGCFGRFAVGGLPAGAHPKVPPRVMLRLLGLLMRWWLTGKGKPSPFFDAGIGAPRVQPRVLDRAEREALRRR